MHLTQKGSKWYLEHRLSPKQKKALGQSKFSRSLRTDSKSEARRRAVPIEYEWRRRIAEAMDESGDEVRSDVALWRRSLENAASDEERENTRALMQDEMEWRTFRAARYSGLDMDDHETIDDLPEAQRARDVYQRATGQKIELTEYLDEYIGRSNSSPKELTQARAAVERFKEYAPFVSDVSLSLAQQYFDDRAATGRARATLQKELSSVRGYWKWLSRRLGTIDRERDPFNVDLAAQSRKVDSSRRAYTAEQAIDLLRLASAKPDPRLADLIRLGMFTGARREELCVLTTEDARLGAVDLLTIRDAKTLAGIRDVPIHPMLRPAIERMKRESDDGYLLPGLVANKYGARGDAIGKRFGRLKTGYGLGSRHVFHSFRNTIKTQLRRSGVPLDIQNELLGHEQNDEMLGVYYDPSLADGREDWQRRLADAMARVRYPELTDEDMA